VWWRGVSSKPAIARIQHLLEVRAGELGHVEELDGIGAHDVTIPRLERSSIKITKSSSR
jgi:hypothetical protein